MKIVKMGCNDNHENFIQAKKLHYTSDSHGRPKANANGQQD